MLRKTLGLCALVAVAACDGNITGNGRNTTAAEHPTVIRRNGGSASSDSLNQTIPSTSTTGSSTAGNGTLGSGY
jgi:hypothetical protein